MGRARRQINCDQGFSHIVFRTNGREFYFDSEFIKTAIILAAKEYKDQYGIKIIDYCIMSNHCHFTMYYPTVEALSAFMHDMNLAIAKTVNKYLKRTGKAIEDRFKSPVICDMRYCHKVIDYIWMNPVKANMLSIQQAQNYRFCSLFYRYRGLRDPIADSYEELKKLTGFDVLGSIVSEQRFAVDRLNALKSEALKELLEDIFDHSHTIGTPEDIKLRIQSFKSKDLDPPQSNDPPIAD